MAIERWAIPTTALLRGALLLLASGELSEMHHDERRYPVNHLYGAALRNSRVRIWMTKSSKGCTLMDASPAVSWVCPNESQLLTLSVPREAKFAIMTIVALQVPCFLVCLSPCCLSIGPKCTVSPSLLPPPWLFFPGFHLTTQRSLHVLPTWACPLPQRNYSLWEKGVGFQVGGIVLKYTCNILHNNKTKIKVDMGSMFVDDSYHLVCSRMNLPVLKYWNSSHTLAPPSWPHSQERLVSASPAGASVPPWTFIWPYLAAT